MRTNLAANRVRRRHDDTGGQGQLRAESLVELVELRDHAHHDDRDHCEREQRQHGRIHERRHHLATHRAEHLHVRHVAAQHLLQAAAALSGHQRRGVDRRDVTRVGVEGVRQRRARSHLFVDVVQHALEDGVRDVAAQDVERLDQRHAGLEQRGQFLVEDEELVELDASAPRRGEAGQAAARRAHVEDEEPLLLELAPERRLAVGGVHALGHLARGRGESAAELHPSGGSRQMQHLPDVGLRLAEGRHATELPDGAGAGVVRGHRLRQVETLEELTQMPDARVDVGGRVVRVAGPAAAAPSPASAASGPWRPCGTARRPDSATRP